jgi:hypothetical protein
LADSAGVLPLEETMVSFRKVWRAVPDLLSEKMTCVFEEPEPYCVTVFFDHAEPMATRRIIACGESD